MENFVIQQKKKQAAERNVFFSAGLCDEDEDKLTIWLNKKWSFQFEFHVMNQKQAGAVEEEREVKRPRSNQTHKLTYNAPMVRLILKV